MDGREALGERIGLGRTADVHAWGDREAIKLLKPGFPDNLAHAEAAVAAVVTDAGLPAPRFRGTARVDGRLGVVYERIEGHSMLVELMRRPWTVQAMARLLAELHAATHALEAAAGLDDWTEGLRRAVAGAGGAAGPAAVGAAIERIATLPDPRALVHGDLHPENVLMTAAGPVVIDWLTAGAGPPAADVARTLFLVRDSDIDPGTPRPRRLAIGLLRRRFAGAYLRRYRELRPLPLPEIEAWRLPILVGRFAEAVEGEAPRLRRLIARELAEAG